jgi:hypothetical protein
VALELPAAAQPERTAVVLIAQQEAQVDYRRARSLGARSPLFDAAVA